MGDGNDQGRVAIREPVLITGAAGFIGRHLARRLVDQGVAVRALLLPDEVAPEAWGTLSTPIEIVRGDVTDPASLRQAFGGARAAGTVVHLAAVVGDWGPEALFQRVTVDGTGHVVDAAAEAGSRLVLASSIVVYGHRLGREVCSEELPHGRALGPYSRAKQAQERLAIERCRERDVELSIVRPANVFGPGSRPWVEMVLPLLHRRQVTLIGGGDHDAGLVHVENLVDLLILAASDAAVGGVYNAADGAEITWRRYFSDLAEIVGAPPPTAAPYLAARAVAPFYERLWTLLRRTERPPLTREALNLAAARYRLPTDRARDELGWSPRVDYAEAIDALAAWLRSSS
ncbi:MAG: NAD-dependent epimerase/dehydratase family protein [Acidobacteriota bacterium]